MTTEHDCFRIGPPYGDEPDPIREFNEQELERFKKIASDIKEKREKEVMAEIGEAETKLDGKAIVGTVFHNTEASHEQLARVMAERIDGALERVRAEIVRATLERACKAMCFGCEQNVPLDPLKKYHECNSAGGHYPCGSYVIRALMEE